MTTLDQVMEAASAYRYRYTDEINLHWGLERAFHEHGIDARPEVAIDGGRIDFLIGGIGVEVKIRGTAREVLRQMHRYAQSPEVESLLLITTMARHRVMPRQIEGKETRVLVLTW